MMAKRKRPHRKSQELDTSGGKLDVLNVQPIGAWPYPRVAVCPLLERSISYADKVLWPLISMAQQGAPFIKMGYGRTDLNRNKAATELLKSNYTHVLMLDIDHTHPDDIIQRLSRWILMDDNIWVVGGLNFRRGAPFEPCVFFYDEDDKVYAPAEWGQGLLEVDVLGTGCVLFDRRVFEAIEPPWFTYDYDGVMKDHWPGEDISFSRRCREAGIPMYCDTTVTSPHMIDGKVTEETFRAYLRHTKETIHLFEDGEKVGEEVAK